MTTRPAHRRPAWPHRDRHRGAPAARSRTRRGHRGRLFAALVLPPALLLAGCTTEGAEPATVQVSRADVTSTVTATGALQAIHEQKLGFPEGGRLAEVNVAVGQQVEKGQVLARIDDFSARKELESARAELAREQAVLDRIRNGNEVAAAEEDVEHARAVLEATEEQAEAVDEANESAVREAELKVEHAKARLEDAEDSDDGCDDSDDHDSGRGGSGDSDDGDQDGRSAEGYDEDHPFFRPASRSEDCDEDHDAEVEAAEERVEESEAALDRAEQRQEVDNTEQELAIENARRDLAAAEHEAEDAGSARPHDIDEQQAIVAQLRTEVDAAQRAVEDTALRAPVAGRVAAVNGVVGEFVGSGSGGATPLAPGGTVPLPDTNSLVSAGDDVGGDDDRPGGGAFIRLDNVDAFRIVAPFAETDAARIEPNQQVRVTFDAVPDLTRGGSVVQISPTGTDIQGVTSYYAVIVLDELDPRLMDGQTASAHVVVEERKNTLVVPNAAVLQSGDSGVVTVLRPDGTHEQVQVELGLSGDSVTQVLSGLEEGQQIVLAQSQE